jgi:hypothetical protein
MCLVLCSAASFACVRFVCWLQYRHTWGTIPESVWQQMAEQVRHGSTPPPMDELLVLADVQAWLDEQNARA